MCLATIFLSGRKLSKTLYSALVNYIILKLQRFISVYSIEKSVLGVGKMRLTRDEQEQAEELWRLIKEGDNPKLFRFSLNEIREMILADQLDPALQELWDRKHSLALADDLSRKCCVEDTE